jgi:hypothetical protein
MAPSTSSKGTELREERRLDALPRFVARPQPIAKRFDHVVGRDAEVRGALLEHLQHGLDDPDHSAEGAVLPPGEAAQSVEVPEELVGAVDDVNDHAKARVLAGVGASVDRTWTTVPPPAAPAPAP